MRYKKLFRNFYKYKFFIAKMSLVNALNYSFILFTLQAVFLATYFIDLPTIAANCVVFKFLHLLNIVYIFLIQLFLIIKCVITF